MIRIRSAVAHGDDQLIGARIVVNTREIIRPGSLGRQGTHRHAHRKELSPTLIHSGSTSSVQETPRNRECSANFPPGPCSPGVARGLQDTQGSMDGDRRPVMHFLDLFSPDSRGQTFLQLGELTLALVLSSLIGLGRRLRASG